MKVVVGSTNPVKLAAVEAAMRHYYPHCSVVGVTVASGVSEQPIGEEETVRGARSRAEAALLSDPSADYGVGLEGGVMTRPNSPNMFSCAWACIVNRRGQVGLGGGLYFELPPRVSEGLRVGNELGPLMDQLTGEHDNKKKGGAIGIFTRGGLNRGNAYTHLVFSAFVRFVSPEWYV
jgi:inosine/xanthosine triphosphatase